MERKTGQTTGLKIDPALLNQESNSVMFLGNDHLERTILTQSSFLQNRPHRNSVWRVDDIETVNDSHGKNLLKSG